ncbi:MAG: hypothetical protein Q9165_000518 [Trypethelium subeluteriae]
MGEGAQFSLRPLASESPEAFRVHLTNNDLTSLGLKPGQLCLLKNSDGVMKGAGIAWRSTDSGTKQGIVKVSHFLKDAYGLKFQQTIVEAGGQWQDVDRVLVRDITGPSSGQTAIDRAECELLIRYTLYKLKAIYPGLTFDLSPREGRKQRFFIDAVEPSLQIEGSQSLYSFTSKTVIGLTDQAFSAPKQDTLIGAIQLRKDAIPGLAHQIQEVNRILRHMTLSEPSMALLKGVILHGPAGVGKSLLLDKLSEAPWNKVARVSLPATKSAISSAFKEAAEFTPSMIRIGNLGSVAGSPEMGGRSGTSQHLDEEMANIRYKRILVIGEARRLDEVDSFLRTSYRFRTEIEIPVPHASARKEILKALSPATVSPGLLDQVGEETHGYVGGDLFALIDEAASSAMDRTLTKQEGLDSHDSISNATKEEESKEESGDIHLTEKDFENARYRVRPSAMREVYLETPNVKFSDIAGSEEVKEQLESVTEWPFKRTKGMAHFGVKPQKGLLLYGPPGCSKTLTAKALAGEGNLNFLSVKGSELISSFVGESERAIREVFRKARGASPSILFFDEIESIAPDRSSSAHTSGLNVVTTLLTEMDGIEALKGVLILAATNKPELLDEALMRPGRFDEKLYVGPPELAARRQILEMNTRKEALHTEVDLERLAMMTEGHSGAEIVRICEKAAQLGLRDCKDPDDIGFIYQAHFDTALRGIPPSITPEVRERFEKWARHKL